MKKTRRRYDREFEVVRMGAKEVSAWAASERSFSNACKCSNASTPFVVVV